MMEEGRCNKKAERILKHILKGELYSKVRDTWAIAKIFPWNTVKFLPSIFFKGQWGQVSVSRGMRGQVELLRAA